MPVAAVLGTGLIGGSVGFALKQAGWNVVGWDPTPGIAEQARTLGALDAVAGSEDEATTSAELIVLAGPPRGIIASLARLDTCALVIDIGGVKQTIVEAPRTVTHFVGTHPMAGREQSGPDVATAALFRGATWVVVTDGAHPDDLDRVSDLVVAFGAVPVRMTAAEHDAAVASISHLPQVVAGALVGLIVDHPEALALASGSFRDLTRVALSPPEVWAELLMENQDAVVAAARNLRDRMTGIIETLEAGDQEHEVAAMLAEARDVRRGLAPPVVAVRVVLEDRPGELAGVGRALAASSVDVRDLQLRHAPHGGGGVLTLSVRPGEAAALREALTAEGFAEA